MTDQRKNRATSRIPMAYKLSLLMVSILVTVTAVQGWLIANQQSEFLEKEIRKFGQGTARLLVRQIKEPLLAQDNLTLEQIIQSAVKDEDVAGVKVMTSDGIQIAASGTSPTSIRPQAGKPAFWTKKKKHRYISFIETAYSNDLKVGEVLVTIHADALDQVKAEARRFIIYSTAMMILIGVVFTAWISKMVTNPIVRLIEISRQIAKGDYQARFNEKHGGELGVLNESLNVMTEKLLHKLHVEQTFSRYVSPKVAKEVLADLAPQELGGKEVNGSVLFADIVGFTALSERIKANEVSRLLNDYFTYVAQAANQCDGYVDKFMGDCAMILFGVPEADSQHVTKSIYCALLIQGVIERLNSERIARGEVTVCFSIGINAGAMLAGNMGSRSRMEYTVLGDTVNVAYRLTSASTQGEIIITESIAAMKEVRSQFSTRLSEAVKLKGRQEFTKIFCVECGNKEIEEKMLRDIDVIFSTIELGY